MLPADIPNRTRSWSRLDGVDILRGLAIFFVLMNHVHIRLLIARIPYTVRIPSPLVSPLFENGQFGVTIFFAISGFLITSTTLRRWGTLSQINVRDFYRLRFARIAPLLFLLLAVLSLLHFAHFKDYVVTAKTGGLGRALLAALTLHLNVLEGRRGWLPGSWDILWSLSIEEMFYLFFPMVSRLLGRSKVFIALLFAFVVYGPFERTIFTQIHTIWREKSYLGGMDAIALGCLTALLVSRIHFSRTQLRAFTAIGMAMLFLVLGFADQHFMYFLGHWGLDSTILALGTCLLITAAAQTQWKAPRVFRPLLNLGERSYEVYLTHVFVVFAFFHLFLRIGKPMWAIPILFIITIVVAALLGEIVARLFSEPMNRLLRKKWREGPAQMGEAIDTHNPSQREMQPTELGR